MKDLVTTVLIIMTPVLIIWSQESDIAIAKQNVACKEHQGVYSYSRRYFPLTCNDGTTIERKDFKNLVGKEIAEELMSLRKK